MRVRTIGFYDSIFFFFFLFTRDEKFYSDPICLYTEDDGKLFENVFKFA